jgi:hypothetical protein
MRDVCCVTHQPAGQVIQASWAGSCGLPAGPLPVQVTRPHMQVETLHCTAQPPSAQVLLAAAAVPAEPHAITHSILRALWAVMQHHGCTNCHVHNVCTLQ